MQVVLVYLQYISANIHTQVCIAA